ncbi:MAG TPA: hypothetical protein VD905_16355 [Flavobacteriales bacterium]|nr:hypothetical protein [Flavobacteriales bacterium]
MKNCLKYRFNNPSGCAGTIKTLCRCAIGGTLKGRLPAFTTMELSVVMLMSGIIAGLAYGGYTLFTKQMYTYSKATNEAFETHHLVQLMKRDVDGCMLLTQNESVLECVYPNSITYYSFQNTNYILRTQAAITDTFKLPVNEFSFLFQGEKAGNTVDEIRFSSEYRKMKVTPVFKKHYSNKQYMEFEMRTY